MIHRAGATATVTIGQQRRRDQHDAERHDEQHDVPERDRHHGQQALHQFRSEMDRLTSWPVWSSSWRAPVEPGQRAEHLGAQVVLHVEGEPAAPVAAQVDAAEVDRGGEHEQPGQRPDGLPLGHDHVVDDLPLHQRYRRRGDRRRQRAAQGDQHRRAVTPAVPRQPPQPPVIRTQRPSRSESSPHARRQVNSRVPGIHFPITT